MTYISHTLNIIFKQNMYLNMGRQNIKKQQNILNNLLGFIRLLKDIGLTLRENAIPVSVAIFSCFQMWRVI